ncbi:MAG: S41 family peptidase, partial [Gemmatimonadaceae bacterium]
MNTSLLRLTLHSLARVAASFAVSAVAVAQLDAQSALFAEPSFSADGKEIAFVSGGDIWMGPAAGGEARLIVGHTANDYRPRLAPDGRRLAFVSTRSGGGDIYILDLTTSELRRLTFEDGAEQLDAWSPDGEWIYYSTSARDIAGMNDVHRVRANGGTPMLVAGDRYASEYWAAPSPDGRRLAITARGTTSGQWWRKGSSHIDEAEVWTVTLDATPQYARVSTGDRPGKGRDVWPMWAPDGRTLYFMSDRDDAENLYAQPVNGGVARALTTFTNGRVLWPQLSRDGTSITFERDFGVWTLDVASGRTARVNFTLRGAPSTPVSERLSITSGVDEFALSPDAKKLVVIVRGELFAADAKTGGNAIRVSSSVAPEAMPAWASDSRRVAYSAWRDGVAKLYLYDFGSRSERALTAGGDDILPAWSPDAKQIAYVRGGKEIRAVDVATGADRLVARGVQLGRVPFISERPLAFSPDGSHLAFLDVGDRGFLNAYVVPLAGGTPQQVSFLANAFGGTIAWSNDGRSLFFDNAQRTEDGQVIRVDLVARAPRFREARFESLFPSDTAQPRGARPAPREGAAASPATPAPSPAPSTVRVDLEGLRRRATSLPLNLSAGGVHISPDGKTLALVGSAAGQNQIWTWPIDDDATEPPQLRQVTSTPGGKGNVRWSPDSKEIWYLSGGRVQVIGVENRQVRSVAVTAELDTDFRGEATEVFRQVWSWTRDNFYDPEMHGVAWDSVRTRFTPVVAAARNPDELRRALGLMIGELNASHSGVGGPASQPPSSGRIGLTFERAAYEREGRLRVTSVMPSGPAAIADGIAIGDVLLAVDGVAIGQGSNLDSLLAFTAGKRVVLRVASQGRGDGRDVAVQPISTGAEKNLMYRAWVDERRAYVNRISNGTLGYVHMIDMGAGSLEQLYIDLDAENHGKQGVVIDIRNNNGGFVNAYALDVFSRRSYLTMERRGGVEVPARLQLGQRAFEKPTVLVTNQHSLSDAEDFTEGYRALGLGQVVGEPTSGWIIYTSNVTLFEGTTLRVPFIRIRDAEGKDMELFPRPVDVRVDRPMGEAYSGRDS